jgi:hypothetical protein
MFVNRREWLCGALTAAMLPAGASAQAESTSLAFDVPVPIDHDRPSAGTMALRCEWGAEPRPDRRTVIAVADAQRYYVRPGGAARLQRDLFGESANLLAIVGRSRSDSLARLVMPEGRTDWNVAYRLLNWRQWAGDLSSVIRHLTIPSERLGLYGRSGGAHLIHQLLTLRPDLGGRAYVQAAVNHPLDVRWGLGADRSWRDLAAADPGLARQALEWLALHPDQRRNLILVIQRQNFFEPLETILSARMAAVRAFLRGDQAEIEAMRDRYQIAALEQMRASLEGVGAAVRVYEFASPHADPRALRSDLQPDVEALFYYASPLADEGYRPAVAPAEWARLREVRGEVLQVAGRHDHTCDYRTQIGLNGLTRGSTLLILDDNHVFRRWTDSGTQPGLVQAFFAGGTASAGFRSALDAMRSLRWRES